MVGPFLPLRCVRRCPTLPHSLPCSTIGAGGLNFRVRDGTGCFPFAKTTETFHTPPTPQHRVGVKLGFGAFRLPHTLYQTQPPHVSTCGRFRVRAVPLTAAPPCEGAGCFLGTAQGREHKLYLFRLKTLLWCVQAARPISTSQLHTLQCFHFWPINPVV